jgi:hypothetical protein
MFSVWDYWVFGLCPLSGILNWICLDSQVRGVGDTYSVGTVRKANIQRVLGSNPNVAVNIKRAYLLEY